MEWSLLHTTRYRYHQPVLLGPQEIRLRPCGPVAGRVRAQRLEIWPRPDLGYWRQDVWNNWVYQAWYSGPTRTLTVVNRLRFRPRKGNPFGFVVEEPVLRYPPAYPPDPGLAPYLDCACDLGEWLQPWRAFVGDSLNLAVQLNLHINQTIAYRARAEMGVQDPLETVERAAGSCRDTAWLLICALRNLGYAARFVSGYSFQPGDLTAELHAWCELYLPGAGWIGLDPGAGLLVNHQHLALARSPRPEAVPPVLGSHDGQGQEVEYRLRLRRVS